MWVRWPLCRPGRRSRCDVCCYMCYVTCCYLCSVTSVALKRLLQRVQSAAACLFGFLCWFIAAVDPKGEKISYADLLVLSTKVATTQAWKEVKVRSACYVMFCYVNSAHLYLCYVVLNVLCCAVYQGGTTTQAWKEVKVRCACHVVLCCIV
jgi:hypothetical protein